MKRNGEARQSKPLKKEDEEGELVNKEEEEEEEVEDDLVSSFQQAQLIQNNKVKETDSNRNNFPDVREVIDYFSFHEGVISGFFFIFKVVECCTTVHDCGVGGYAW